MPLLRDAAAAADATSPRKNGRQNNVPSDPSNGGGDIFATAGPLLAGPDTAFPECSLIVHRYTTAAAATPPGKPPHYERTVGLCWKGNAVTLRRVLRVHRYTMSKQSG
jgi:hypothetical protein